MLELRRDDAAAFFEAPYAAYEGDERFVQPLRMDLLRQIDAAKNPLFKGGAPRELWTVHREGRAVGRIICHLHPASNARFGWRRAYFGMFAAPDNAQAARMLLGAAEGFARAQGCDTVMGNFDLTAMQQIGVMTVGFDTPAYVDQAWNPPHIPRLLAENGFAQTFPMRTFEVDVNAVDLASLEEKFLTPARGDATLRWQPLVPKELPSALRDIRAVLNDSFDANPMFVPLTDDEMAFQADGLSHVIDPALTALVHDEQGPGAVIVCIPDLNPFFRETRSRLSWRTPGAFWRLKTRRDRAVVIFGGVAPRLRARGMAGALITMIIRALRDRGYKRLGVTWIADQNAGSLAQMRRIGARELHRCALFSKAVVA